jgi:hypothetical protein
MRRKPEQRRPLDRSQSTNVFSYYSSRSGGETQRARYEPPTTERRGLDRLKHIPTTLAVVVIFSSVLYASLLDNRPRVMIIASETGKPLQRPTEVYENFISQELSRSAFNKSKLTINTEPLEQTLQRQFPEVANAAVTLPLIGHRPIVSIAVSSPAFVLATSGGAYYVSPEGVPLVRVSDVQNPLKDIATVSDTSGLPVTIGRQVLPSETVGFISTVIAQLNATETKFTSIALPLEANELQLQLADKPYIVRFNTTEDAQVQVGTLLAVKNRLEGSGEVPKEYIDIRVPERAYYK